MYLLIADTLTRCQLCRYRKTPCLLNAW